MCLDESHRVVFAILVTNRASSIRAWWGCLEHFNDVLENALHDIGRGVS
jgi:hypothetical protein